MEENKNLEKRFFFAFDLIAPWQEEPQGRYIDKDFRHITLAFLKDTPTKKIDSIIIDSIRINSIIKDKKFPIPSFLEISPVGFFDKLLFLPSFKPRVIALRAKFLSFEKEVIAYQKELISYLLSKDIDIKMKNKNSEFLPHVSLARKPFNRRDWRENFFYKIPFIIRGLNFYESLGNSKYKIYKNFKKDFALPFEEIEHTADIAFRVRGKDFYQLYINAYIALSFKFPKFLDYLEEGVNIKNIEDVIMNLNDSVSKMDSDIGSPFKAVSFQANVKILKNILHWEMIVDV